MIIEYPKIELPTEPGWYWYYGPCYERWTCVEVYIDSRDGILSASGPGILSSVSASQGLWRGPIQEPTP